MPDFFSGIFRSPGGQNLEGGQAGEAAELEGEEAAPETPRAAKNRRGETGRAWRRGERFIMKYYKIMIKWELGTPG